MSDLEGGDAGSSGALRPAPVEPGERVAIERERVLIRSYPKTIFFYPTALTASLCALASAAGAVADQTLGFLFCAVFFFNLVVVSFEFRKHTPVVLLLVLLVLVLGGVLLHERFAFLSLAKSAYSKLNLAANTHFYIGVAISFFALYLFIAIDSRFDYWEVRGNEILHHTGLLGDCERYPATSLRVRKEIVDIFEYALLLSGRLILYPSGRDQAIVLENVPWINRVEAQLDEMLDSVRVVVEKD